MILLGYCWPHGNQLNGFVNYMVNFFSTEQGAELFKGIKVVTSKTFTFTVKNQGVRSTEIAMIVAEQ